MAHLFGQHPVSSFSTSILSPVGSLRTKAKHRGQGRARGDGGGGTAEGRKGKNLKAVETAGKRKAGQSSVLHAGIWFYQALSKVTSESPGPPNVLTPAQRKFKSMPLLGEARRFQGNPHPRPARLCNLCGPLLRFRESETGHNLRRLESVWPWGTWRRRPRGSTAPWERYRTPQVKVWRGVAGGGRAVGESGDPVAGLRQSPRGSPVLSWDDIPPWLRAGIGQASPGRGGPGLCS